MTMCDEVLADLNKPKKRVSGFLPKQFERLPQGKTVSYDGFDAAKRCYQEIRRASRYVISNDLLEYLVPIFCEMPADELVERIIEARLPHPNMWIEWNEIKRQTLMREWAEENDYAANWTDPDELTPQVGYLCMETGTPGDVCWLATPFGNASIYGDYTVVAPHGFTVYPDLDSPLRKAIALSEKGGEIMIEVRDRTADPVMQIVTAAIGHGYMKGKKNFMTAISPSENIANLMSGLSSNQTFASEWLDQNHSGKDWIGLTQQMVGGDARFLIALLSILNYDWIVKDEVTATAAPRRIRHGKLLPRNSHMTLSIDLPKAKGVTMLPAPYVEGASRRQHEVRGHWRLHRTTGKRSWVRAHKRGDAKLGVITKDYSLQARRRR